MQLVSLTDLTPGAVTYYTTNGTTPTTSSNKYTGPGDLREPLTIHAIAIAPGLAPSEVASATYSFTAATPVANLAEGSYASPQTVAIKCATPTAGIWYTLNGITPQANPSVSTPYTGPITISSTRTLKVIAVETGFTSSPVVTEHYAIGALPPPILSPPSWCANARVSVKMADSAPGISVYYTTDGTTPTLQSTKYTGPIAVNSSETLKAVAIFPGAPPSGITTGAYVVKFLSLIAGDGNYGYAGDGGPAVEAQISDPYGLAFDREGNLYIADTGNNRVRMVSRATGIISTVAGIGYATHFSSGTREVAGHRTAAYEHDLAIAFFFSSFCALAPASSCAKITLPEYYERGFAL